MPHGNEEWRQVEDFSNYWISESGKVWLQERIVPDGRRFRAKFLKGSRCGKYPSYCMQDDEGNWHNKYTHHLVAEAFIGPRPDGLNVLHKDDDKENSHRSNLEYGTQSKNIKQAYDRGTRHGNSMGIYAEMYK